MQVVSIMMLWVVNLGWALMSVLCDGDVRLIYCWEKCVWVSTWRSPFPWLGDVLEGLARRVYAGYVGGYFGGWDDGDDMVNLITLFCVRHSRTVHQPRTGDIP